ncbi:MAG: hypothetical protein GY730_10440 [bacterium]|nr:hypothetical protein [bacterium]
MGLNVGSGLPGTRGWDSGKPGQNKQVQKAFSVEETQHTARNVETTKSPETVNPVKSPAPPAETITKQPLEPTARPMTKGDIIDQLLQIKSQPSSENQQILLSMLEHGIEASSDSFENISRMLKGKSKASDLKSAIISHSKNLSTSPKSVDILSSVLSDNQKLAKLLQKTQQSLSSFQSQLLNSKELFSSKLMSLVPSILSEYDDNLKKILKKATRKDIDISQFKRSDFIYDSKALNGFLSGIAQKLSNFKNNATARQLLNKLFILKKDIEKSMEALVYQMILSKSTDQNHKIGKEEFSYWQFPNPFAQTPSNIDILIRKNNASKKKDIDPSKTKIILRFDTLDMGEVYVIIEIQDQKIWYTFETGKGETKKNISKLIPALQKAMAAHNYEIVGVKTLPRKTDIKKVLIPTIKLDDFSRIRTEV